MDIDRPILTKQGKQPQTQDELAKIMLDASIEVSIRKPSNLSKDDGWSGSSIDLDIPDFLVLAIHNSTDLIVSETRCFNLEHRDQTRFPWKSN